MVTALLLLLSLAGADPAEKMFADAEALMRDGKLEAAAEAYRKIVKLHPDWSEAYFSLGVCYVQLSRPVEAGAALEQYVNRVPDSADGRAALGLVLLGQGRLPQARRELETALKLDPAQPEAVKGLGRLYNLSGEPRLAVALLRPLVNSPAGDEEARGILAAGLWRNGDVAAAAEQMATVLRQNPRAPVESYVLAAVISSKLGDWPRVIEICEQGMQTYPRSERIEKVYLTMPWEKLAQRTQERLKTQKMDVAQVVAVARILTDAEMAPSAGLLQIAEPLLRRAVELAPTDAAARFHLGRCLRTQARKEEALQVFREALELKPDDELRAHIYTRIGGVEAQLQHYEQADQAYRMALEIDRKLKPPLPEIGYEYVQFLSVRGRTEEARRLTAEILVWEPFYFPVRMEYAKQLGEQEEWPKAIEEAERVVGNTEDAQLLRTAHAFLARAYHLVDKPEDAARHQKWVEEHSKAEK